MKEKYISDTFHHIGLSVTLEEIQDKLVCYNFCIHFRTSYLYFEAIFTDRDKLMVATIVACITPLAI